MSGTEKDIIRKVKQWLVYGDEDMRLAECGLKLLENCPHRLVAYHAQQCAEKYLKAYLVYKGIEFPYTHNIGFLLELCAPLGSWSETLESAEELTPFAVSTRYPGEDEDVNLSEATNAIEIASKVRSTILSVLKAANFPF